MFQQRDSPLVDFQCKLKFDKLCSKKRNEGRVHSLNSPPSAARRWSSLVNPDPPPPRLSSLLRGCVLFSLLPQILFHCKMMPISKASRQWLWSGSSVIPAGKVIWVGSYFQPAMLPGILQGAATVL